MLHQTCAQRRWCECRPGPARCQLQCRPRAGATCTAPPAAHPALRAGPHPVPVPNPLCHNMSIHTSPEYGCRNRSGNTQILNVRDETVKACCPTAAAADARQRPRLHQLHDQQHGPAVFRRSSTVNLHNIGVSADPLRQLYLSVAQNCHVRGQHSAAGQLVLLVTRDCSFVNQKRCTHNATKVCCCTVSYLTLHGICQAAIQRQHLHSHMPVQVPPLVYLPPTPRCNKQRE